MQKHLLANSNFEYYTKGSDPILLLHAGTHGDELEVIDHVTSCILNFESRLPSFIYIPHVSPSAVHSNTRRNGRDCDLNRIFLDGSDDPEVGWNQEVMNMGQYDLAVSFHEDPEYKTYYIYDEGGNRVVSSLVQDHNKYLSDHGISLLTGRDDLLDPTNIPTDFVNGYHQFDFEKGTYTGEILNWGMNKGCIKHSLLSETPGSASPDEKLLIIDSFFEMVILKFFH